jgi:hypothetical protein
LPTLRRCLPSEVCQQDFLKIWFIDFIYVALVIIIILLQNIIISRVTFDLIERCSKVFALAEQVLAFIAQQYHY